MLDTNLESLEALEALQEALKSHDNVMICCGRMGPMCLPVYAVMDGVRSEYEHVSFFAQDFDGPAAGYIRSLPECAGFMGLPFSVYFKNGKVVAATSSIQTREQVVSNLDKAFGGAQ